MKKITTCLCVIIFKAVFLSSCASTQTKKFLANNSNTSEKITTGQPESPEFIKQRIAISKPIVNSWINSMKAIATQTGQKDLWQIINIASNRSYAMPIEYNNRPASKSLTAIPDQTRNGIVYAVITNDDVAKLPLWKAKLQKENYAASYDQGTVMIEESQNNKMTNKYFKGLILFHEMKHWSQDVVEHKSDLSLLLEREMDAYEFEFEILDLLKLPGYDEFLKQEVKNINLTNPIINPYLDDPRIEQMFGACGSNEEKMMICTVLFYRVVFKKYEQEPSTAMQNKIKFLAGRSAI